MMFNRPAGPGPSPRAPVAKREQPPSPAFSPAGLAASQSYGFTKGVTIKRQNISQSPLHRQSKPHHEFLKQEVAYKLKKTKPLTPKSKFHSSSQQRMFAKPAPIGPVDSENVQKQQQPTIINQAPPNGVKRMEIDSKPVKAVKPKKMSKKKQLAMMMDEEAGGGRWTQDEDRKLRQGVSAIGPTKWKKISEDYLGGKRSDVQCLHRWQKVLRPGLVKGPWTEEEDNTIRSCIARKVTKWSEIAERIPGRIGKQCRERWFNHLDPSIDHSAWSDQEEKVLVTAQAKYGNRWCEIAKLLPGRPENAVKNRWNSAIRRKWQTKLGLTVTDNKGRPINPQPPRPAAPLPLPELVPVVKKKLTAEEAAALVAASSKKTKSDVKKTSALKQQKLQVRPASIDSHQKRQQAQQPRMLADPPSIIKASRSSKDPMPPPVVPQVFETTAFMAPQPVKKPVRIEASSVTKKKQVKSITVTTRKKPVKSITVTAKKKPVKSVTAKTKKARTSSRKKKAAASIPKLAPPASAPSDVALNFNLGAASPVGPFQWDFQPDHGLDLSTTDFGLDSDMFNLKPLSHNNSSQQRFLMLQQQVLRGGNNMNRQIAGAVSPIAALPMSWENLQPAELDRGMASLTLSMLDTEFDVLNSTALKTDDSFGVNWNPSALSPSFASPK